MDTNSKLFCDALERRSKRLVQLIEMSAPAHLISSEVMLVIQSAMRCYPKELSQVFVDWVASVSRRATQCPTCKEAVKPSDGGHHNV